MAKRIALLVLLGAVLVASLAGCAPVRAPPSPGTSQMAYAPRRAATAAQSCADRDGDDHRYGHAHCDADRDAAADAYAHAAGYADRLRIRLRQPPPRPADRYANAACAHRHQHAHTDRRAAAHADFPAGSYLLARPPQLHAGRTCSWGRRATARASRLQRDRDRDLLRRRRATGRRNRGFAPCRRQRPCRTTRSSVSRQRARQRGLHTIRPCVGMT